MDELWDSRNWGGAKSWYETTTPELRAFCDELADRIVARGSEPIWGNVNRHVEERWPGQCPSTNTVKDNVRRLVKARTRE